jgi:hypothetical protein
MDTPPRSHAGLSASTTAVRNNCRTILRGNTVARRRIFDIVELRSTKIRVSTLSTTATANIYRQSCTTPLVRRGERFFALTLSGGAGTLPQSGRVWIVGVRGAAAMSVDRIEASGAWIGGSMGSLELPVTATGSALVDGQPSGTRRRADAKIATCYRVASGNGAFWIDSELVAVAV